MAASPLYLCLAILFIGLVACAEEKDEEVVEVPILKCYNCKELVVWDGTDQSNATRKCLDEAFDPEELQGKDPEVDVVTCGPTENACMKVYLTNYDVIMGKKELVTRSVKRGCASVKEEDLGCDHDRGSAAYASRCYCTDPKCNSASTQSVCAYLLALISVFCVMFSRA